MFKILLSICLILAPITAYASPAYAPYPATSTSSTPPVIAAPTSIGSVVMSAAARSSATLTTTAAIPGGSLAFCGVLAPFSTAQTISSVSDGTNTYTAAVTNAFDAGTQLVAAIYYKQNATAVSSGATVTASFSGNTIAQPSIIVCGYTTGIITASSLDKTNSGLLAPGTAYASNSTGTLSQANEIAIGFLGEYNASVTITEGSGFTTLNAPSTLR